MKAMPGVAEPRRVLAIEGGRSVRARPPPPWPYFEVDEIAAVSATLRSGNVNQWTGSQVWSFQTEFGDLHDRPAVAVANGSAALEIALRALGVGSGDEVIVPARSFVATASCVALVGARPVFADIDLETHIVTPEQIERRITSRTRAIIVVHLYGRPCDMPAITTLAKKHGLLVIEDCAQSLGGMIDGRPLGTFSDAAAFSFCQDKIVSTGGEGGMILFSEHADWRRAWSFKDHGKDIDLALAPSSPDGYRWLHASVGTNLRMTEIQAAIGRAQLAKLEGWIEKRNVIADRLATALRRYPCVVLPDVPAGHRHARYRLEFSIVDGKLAPGWSRDRIMQALLAEGIAATVGTCPDISREKAFAHDVHAELPNARRVGQSALLMLTHPTIDHAYLADCEAAIAKVFDTASK